MTEGLVPLQEKSFPSSKEIKRFSRYNDQKPILNKISFCSSRHVPVFSGLNKMSIFKLAPKATIFLNDPERDRNKAQFFKARSKKHLAKRFEHGHQCFFKVKSACVCLNV